MPAIKAALFDIGNVLVTFDHTLATDRVLPHSRVTQPELFTAIMSRIPQLETGSMSSQTFLEEVCQEIGFSKSPEEFEAAYVDIFQINQPQWDLVRKLQSQMTLCLFSNTSQIHEEYLFKRYPEFEQFHTGIYSWREGCMKPDRRIYEIALERLPFAPEEIIYLDDLPANVAAGVEMGFQTHAYDHRNHQAALDWLAGLGLS